MVSSDRHPLCSVIPLTFIATVSVMLGSIISSLSEHKREQSVLPNLTEKLLVQRLGSHECSFFRKQFIILCLRHNVIEG